jgi:hypothetical protein
VELFKQLQVTRLVIANILVGDAQASMLVRGAPTQKGRCIRAWRPFDGNETTGGATPALLPGVDAGEDALGWRPDEGFWIGVCLGDEAVDSDLDINDGPGHAAIDATRVSLAKKPSTAVSRLAWVGVQRPVGMPGQPLAYLRMLAGRTVVDDGVDHFSYRGLLLDGAEEAHESLLATAPLVATDERSRMLIVVISVMVP